jgi:hypothetical protein
VRVLSVRVKLRKQVVNDTRHVVPDDDEIAPAVAVQLPVADQVALAAVGLVQVPELVVRRAELHVVQHGVHEQAPKALVLEPRGARSDRHHVPLG